MSVRSALVGRAISLLIPFILVIVLDRLAKSWVRGNLWDPPRELVIIPGWLELTPVVNRGIAFGILQEAGAWLAIVAIVVLAVVAGKSWRQLLTASLIVRIPIGLIAGGAIGNVIDRLLYGYVTDFIHVPPIVLFQVFNVADASICVGAATLAVALWFGERRPGKKPDSEPAPAGG